MSTIEKERQAEQDIIESKLIEKKLARKNVDKPVAEKKKGQPVNFKPASRIPKLEAPEGYRVAWKHNTPENVRRCQYEGWEVANRIEHNMDVQMGDYYKKINDKPASELSSNIVHNELIAMLVPDEVAIARKEYYRQETEQQTRTKLQPEKTASAFMQDKAKITSAIEIN